MGGKETLQPFCPTGLACVCPPELASGAVWHCLLSSASLLAGWTVGNGVGEASQCQLVPSHSCDLSALGGQADRFQDTWDPTKLEPGGALVSSPVCLGVTFLPHCLLHGQACVERVKGAMNGGILGCCDTPGAWSPMPPISGFLLVSDRASGRFLHSCTAWVGIRWGR